MAWSYLPSVLQVFQIGGIPFRALQGKHAKGHISQKEGMARQLMEGGIVTSELGEEAGQPSVGDQGVFWVKRYTEER